jgi:hypothetical protein
MSWHIGVCFSPHSCRETGNGTVRSKGRLHLQHSRRLS